MGPPSSPSCKHNLDTLVQICNYLDIPLALEKVDGPSTALPFLDTVAMETRLPGNKLTRLKEEVSKWIDQQNGRFSLLLGPCSMPPTRLDEVELSFSECMRLQ